MTPEFVRVDHLPNGVAHLDADPAGLGCCGELEPDHQFGVWPVHGRDGFYAHWAAGDDGDRPVPCPDYASGVSRCGLTPLN